MAVQYANGHVVFRILGAFGEAGVAKMDHWSTGFRIGTVGADVGAGAGLQAFLTAVAPAIQTFHSSASAQAGTNVFLEELTAASVGTDGKYAPASQVTTRHTYPTPVAGTGGPALPWNTALVISLRTQFPRGIASNGRAYWPTTAHVPVFNTGRLATSPQNGFVAAAKVMINAINTAASANIGASTYVIVAGATGKTGSARNARVTSIRADNRFDSIERRENDQAPVWSTATIP